MAKLIAILLFALASVVSAADSATFQLLPADSVEADASYLGADQETERISEKMVQALASDRDWLRAYIGKLNLKPGETLPYHPRFGVTKSEYELLVSKVDKLSLISIGKVEVKVEKSPDRTTLVIVGDKLRLSLLVNTSKNTFTTSRGELTKRTQVNVDKSSPLGPWTGEQWSRIDEKSGFSEKLAIGKSSDGLKVIIYYDIRSPSDGVESHFIVRYSVQGAARPFSQR